MDTIRIGIIGANAQRGWGREAHIPAIHATAGLTLAAVASRTPEAATAAAAAFGAERAYGDPAALLADPSIDAVAVVTAVPAHRDLILAAASAGKHVLTEWPVGVDAEETEAIAAATGGVTTAVGLQARMSPAVLEARRRIRAGELGRIEGLSILSTTAAFGERVPEEAEPLELPATGMNLRTIQTAHTLDLAGWLLGPLSGLRSIGDVQHPDVEVLGTGRHLHRTLPDRFGVLAAGPDGALVTAQVVGGRPPERTPFRLEVLGSRGTIVLTGGGPRGFQASRLSLEVDGRPVGTTARDGLPDSVVNVAGVYAAFVEDVRTGSRTAPTFDDAVRLFSTIDLLQQGAQAPSPDDQGLVITHIKEHG